jgi:hypothetical protein
MYAWHGAEFFSLNHLLLEQRASGNDVMKTRLHTRIPFTPLLRWNDDDDDKAQGCYYK